MLPSIDDDWPTQWRFPLRRSKTAASNATRAHQIECPTEGARSRDVRWLVYGAKPTLISFGFCDTWYQSKGTWISGEKVPKPCVGLGMTRQGKPESCGLGNTAAPENLKKRSRHRVPCMRPRPPSKTSKPKRIGKNSKRGTECTKARWNRYLGRATKAPKLWGNYRVKIKGTVPLVTASYVSIC